MSEDDSQQVYDWLMQHYGEQMSGRDRVMHKQLLVDKDFSGCLPRDLDNVLQGARYARACIRLRDGEPVPQGEVQ